MDIIQQYNQIIIDEAQKWDAEVNDLYRLVADSHENFRPYTSDGEIDFIHWSKDGALVLGSKVTASLERI